MVNIPGVGRPILAGASRSAAEVPRRAVTRDLEDDLMQPDYEPYLALYKYGIHSALAAATGYFEFARQLRSLQLKTDKEMLAFAQEANAQVNAATSLTAMCALHQKLMTDLMGREFGYLKEMEKIARETSTMTAAALRESKNPWQERMSQIAESTAKFLADGNAVAAMTRAGQ
ncbi:hypothetical protein N7373_06125 [Achromobacter mucicolens]|uniref:hypothetical protein n=1 Tax=Achromobacter mucicolens TaxID=1389922 RepID=UPI00244961D6|nr:hypothetical protein [Achromobacter mucicolens]MDH0091015.1 hypothetical protein [Achromobacter mucicolens]